MAAQAAISKMVVHGLAISLGLLVCVATVPESAQAAYESSADGAAASDGGSYNLKLRQIEERVNELKEKIFQSKARLMQLQEIVLHGAIAGAKAVLVHKNDMGSSFRLARLQYTLDGAQVFNRVDDGSGTLSDQAEIEVFNGAIAPGSHQLTVYLEYAGAGFGLFSYLEGYTFKLRANHTFTVEEGKVTTVNIVGFEKGGLTTPLEQRPSLEFDVDSSRALRDEAKSGSDTPAAAGGQS